MKSLLKELALGDINFYENKFSHGLDYKKALDNLEKLENEFFSTLNKSEKALFDRFCDAGSDISIHDRADYFVYGYKLGSLIMMELMSDGDG